MNRVALFLGLAVAIAAASFLLLGMLLLPAVGLKGQWRTMIPGAISGGSIEACHDHPLDLLGRGVGRIADLPRPHRQVFHVGGSLCLDAGGDLDGEGGSGGALLDAAACEASLKAALGDLVAPRQIREGRGTG